MFQFQLCTMYLVVQIQLVRLLLIKLQCILHWASRLGPAIADVCKYVYTSIPSLLLCIIHSLFCVGTGFCKLLQQCNNQQKQHTTNLEDICDGNRYQLLLQNSYSHGQVPLSQVVLEILTWIGLSIDSWSSTFYYLYLGPPSHLTLLAVMRVFSAVYIAVFMLRLNRAFSYRHCPAKYMHGILDRRVSYRIFCWRGKTIDHR